MEGQTYVHQRSSANLSSQFVSPMFPENILRADKAPIQATRTPLLFSSFRLCHISALHLSSAHSVPSSVRLCSSTCHSLLLLLHPGCPPPLSRWIRSMTHILEVAGAQSWISVFYIRVETGIHILEASKPPDVLGIRAVSAPCILHASHSVTRALQGLNMIYVAPTTFSEMYILTKIALTQTGRPPERANTLQLGGCFTRIRLTQTEPKLWQVARKLKPVNSPIEQGTMTWWRYIRRRGREEHYDDNES